MKNSINFTDVGDLWERNYPNQFPEIMPAYLYVDLRGEGEIYADTYNYQISGTPMVEWHGHIRSFALPDNVDALALRDWVDEEIMPYAERIHAGYEEYWDGNNYAARFDDDAAEALEDLEVYIVDMCNVPMVENGGLWDAGDWLQESGWIDEDKNIYELEGYTITPDTTDEYIAEISKELKAGAKTDGAYVEGFRGFFEEIRDQLRDSVESD